MVSTLSKGTKILRPVNNAKDFSGESGRGRGHVTRDAGNTVEVKWEFGLVRPVPGGAREELGMELSSR